MHLGSPYQPNPFGISNQLCNWTNPNCTHPHQSSIKQHQSLNLPKPFQLPPCKATPPNLQQETQYPPTMPPNMPSNSHTTPPTTPNRMSSNPHTTPPTTPNMSSNPPTTTTRPTPGTISTHKCQDLTYMTSNPYPTPYPTPNFQPTSQFVTDEELLHQLLSNTPTTLPQHPPTFNNLPPNPLHHPHLLQRQPPHIQQLAF